MSPRAHLLQLVRVALRAADPFEAAAKAVPDDLPLHVHVIAAGKAAGRMLDGFLSVYGGACSGLLITPNPLPPRSQFETIVAGHPVPDEGSFRAGRRALDLAASLGADDVCVVLLSGGASALMACPVDGISVQDKQTITQQLLSSGAPIGEMNCVRRHLSRIKGGRLASAIDPARCITLAVSDVVGDPPADIASGPTVGDSTSLGDARVVLDRWGIEAPPRVRAALSHPAHETPYPDDPRLSRSDYRLIANSAGALGAAMREAALLGYDPVDLGADVVGDAVTVARDHAACALEAVEHGRPVALISGGELTVTLSGPAGSGGPNQTYVLALAEALNGHPDIWALACDTDGKDGVSTDGLDVAGGIITPDTLARARARGFDVQTALDTYDSGTVLRALDDAVITGPTGTNVNDFRVIFVGSRI